MPWKNLQAQSIHVPVITKQRHFQSTDLQCIEKGQKKHDKESMYWNRFNFIPHLPKYNLDIFISSHANNAFTWCLYGQAVGRGEREGGRGGEERERESNNITKQQAVPNYVITQQGSNQNDAVGHYFSRKAGVCFYSLLFKSCLNCQINLTACTSTLLCVKNNCFLLMNSIDSDLWHSNRPAVWLKETTIMSCGEWTETFHASCQHYECK